MIWPPAPLRGGPGPARRAIALTLLLAFVLACGAALMWWQAERARQELQRQTVLRAEQRAQQVSSVLAAHMQALIGSVDLALLQLRREWRGDAATFDPIVRSLLAVLPGGAVSHVVVADADGNGIYHSLDPGERVNVADREHFRAQRRGGDQLQVGLPMRSRLAGDKWVVTVNRPLLRGGRFVGTINMSLPTAYLAQQLAALPLGEQAIAALVHASDGSFVARSSDHDRAMGRRLPADRPFLSEPAAPRGLFQALGEVDQVTRLYAWTRIPALGLVATVGLAEAEALEPLGAGRGREQLVLGVLLAVVLCAGAAVSWLQWQAARQQQALARSERRYRTLIDSSPDAIFVSREGRFAYVNPATVQLLGAADAGQLVGQPVLDRVHADLHDQVAARRDRVLRELQAVPPMEQRYLRMDGSEIEVEVTAAPLTDEQGSASLVIVRDITERRRHARALQQLADDLERRVSDRTRELERARDEAEHANRAKSEFLSRMSHELRTPLNAILGFGQLLEMELPPNGQQAKVRQVVAAGRHLLALINDMLDLARIEAGRVSVSIEVVALHPLVEECLTLLRPQAQTQGIRLSAPAPDTRHQVHADRTRLKQVLLNLLSNAIKYNRAQGSVSVHIEDAGALWRVCVVDSGPGLDAGQQARLFVPFERLDAASSTTEGTGIGLALSRRLIELMHGRIGVHSEPGRGSRFWFELPKAPDGQPLPAPAAPAAGASPPRLDGAPLELLCIEDNPVNLMLIEHVVAMRARWRLRSTDSPGEGLALARAHRPRLILLDIHLPEMDGWTVMRMLREDPATRDIPVLAVSAHAMPSDLDRGRAAGFADYLTKPLQLDRLLAALDAYAA